MTRRTYWRLHWDGRGVRWGADEAYSAPWGSAEDPQRGYSCCRSLDALLDYLGQDDCLDGSEDVVVFAGDEVGEGPDGEPLVVPTGPARWFHLADLVEG